MSDTPAIEAEGLIKNYGKTRALNGLDLAVAPGSVYGLLGPNGAARPPRFACHVAAARRRTPRHGPRRGHPGRGGTPGHRADGQYAALDEYLTGVEPRDDRPAQQADLPGRRAPGR